LPERLWELALGDQSPEEGSTLLGVFPRRAECGADIRPRPGEAWPMLSKLLPVSLNGAEGIK